jgi:hypothetical protein
MLLTTPSMESLESRLCLSSSGVTPSAHQLHVIDLHVVHVRHLAHLRHLRAALSAVAAAAGADTGSALTTSPTTTGINAGLLGMMDNSSVLNTDVGTTTITTNPIGTIPAIDTTAPIGTAAPVGGSTTPLGPIGTIGGGGATIGFTGVGAIGTSPFNSGTLIGTTGTSVNASLLM